MGASGTSTSAAPSLPCELSRLDSHASEVEPPSFFFPVRSDRKRSRTTSRRKERYLPVVSTRDAPLQPWHELDKMLRCCVERP